MSIFKHNDDKNVGIKKESINQISKEQYFYLDDGREVKSIRELYDIIDSINSDEFIKHQINNNFGNWVKGVFNDNDLHHKLLWAKNKDDYKLILEEELGIKKEDIINELEKAEINNKAPGELTSELKKEIMENEIILEEKKNEKIEQAVKTELGLEKDVADDEKSMFDVVNYNNIIAIAEKEFNQNNYESALNNYESAMKIRKDDSILEIMDIIKAEISKIEKKKKDEDFLINSEKKSFASQIESFNLKFNELKDRIKNLRKEGKDVYIADIHLMPLKSKIMIAEVTKAKKDLDVIKNLIIFVQKELDEVELDKIVDVRAEIEEGAKKLIDDEIKKEISA